MFFLTEVFDIQEVGVKKNIRLEQIPLTYVCT